jgi:hypothetical protein
MRFQTLGRGLLLLAMLALVACHKKEDQTASSTPGGDTPAAAVEQSVALIKNGDFDGFWKHGLPPADYAQLRADWTLARPGEGSITDDDRAQFNLAVEHLTEPGAETKLYEELKPKLDQMDEKYHDQLPVLISIGQAVLSTGIAQNKTMTQTQKQQARDVLNAMLPWAQQTPWFDQDKAKQAVGVVVATSRQLNLKSADQVQNMDFDTAMKEYSVAYGGIKQLLTIYGLSVDDTLNSVKVSTVSQDNNQAHVKIDYTLLGKPISTDSQLVQIDGRWYSQDLIDSEHARHERILHPAPAASSAPAPAGTIPAPAASTTKMASAVPVKS